MKVTKVYINDVNKNNLLAYATIQLDEVLYIKNFKIIYGKNGPFVSFPSEYWDSDKQYHDTVFGKNEITEKISNAILEEYENSVDELPMKEEKLEPVKLRQKSRR